MPNWTSVLARLGMPTGDGRIIIPNALTNRSLPLPLMWQRSSEEGHGGSVVVGRIESMEFAPDMVTAQGTMLDVPEAAEVTKLIEAGVIGPSVDLDDLTFVVDEEERMIITEARVSGATLVPIPAFADVSITMGNGETAPMLVASVRSEGWTDMPLADQARVWDGDAAAGRVLAWATDGDETDWSRYARAFLRKDDDADPETKGAYGFGIADVIDGTLTIVPRGVFAAAAAVQGARTGSEPAEADAMRSVLRGIYDRMDQEAPFVLAPRIREAPLVAAANPAPSPMSWFANPLLGEPTPLTKTEEGRVFGHITTWATCHVGLPGCTTAPSSPSGYAYFLTHEHATDAGTIPVGVLSVGGGHAAPDMGFVAATQHYDDVGAAVAHVNIGEDDHGIWVAGTVLDYADPTKIEQFKSSPVSGDWRRIGGALELIAVCSVNTPGFPIPRARAHASMSLGKARSLVMALVQPVMGEIEDIAKGNPVKTYDTETGQAKWAWANRKGR